MVEYFFTVVSTGLIVLGASVVSKEISGWILLWWLIFLPFYTLIYYGGIYWREAKSLRELYPDAGILAINQYKRALSLLTITLVIVLTFAAVIWIH